MQSDAELSKPFKLSSVAGLRFARELFKTVVHHICWVCEDPRMLSQRKLNFILWYADRHIYFEAGCPLTGATYIKHQNGPRARAIGPVLDELQREGMIVRRAASAMTDEQLLFALRRPSLAALDAAHISIVDAVTRSVCLGEPLSAINRPAHDLVFRIAQLGEVLPLFTVFAGRPGEIGPGEIRWAMQEVRVVENGEADTDPGFAPASHCQAAMDALFWHLHRDPSIGLSVPGTELSWFIYKQAGAAALDVPELTLLYRFDLGEVVVGGIRRRDADMSQADDDDGD